MKYWSQNQYLEIKFDLRQGLPNDPPDLRSGFNIWSFVYNTRHKVSLLLGTRSRGFVWFFSFLSWFSTQDWKEPLILLLDEPALFLHAKAQEDMLQYMEQELKPKHQVIYTTHSPWMVDSNRFDRARIVEDKTMEKEKMPPVEEQGTKVKVDVLDSSPESVFPIQAALGYEIYQTLFIGPNSLVVEGVSDLIYLQVMTGLLQTNHLVGLDTRWTITPVGGSDKVPTFIALIGAQTKIKVATLLDIKPGDKQKIENLYKKKLLKKKDVITFDNYTGSIVSDMEDMFDVDFFLKLINEEYKKELGKAIVQTNLNNSIPGINNRIDEYLKSNPLKGNIQFSHYRSARYFMENVQTLKDEISTDTYTRFARLFTDLNGLL